MHNRKPDPLSIFDDLDCLKLTPEDLASGLFAADVPVRELETEVLKRRRGNFLRGPYPWSQFCIASRLPGKALPVWMLLQHRMRLIHETEVTLPTGVLEEAGVNRNAKARALRDLERVGLIRVIRGRGRSPRVARVTIAATETPPSGRERAPVTDFNAEPSPEYQRLKAELDAIIKQQFFDEVRQVEADARRTRVAGRICKGRHAASSCSHASKPTLLRFLGPS